jgi:hypothetical protein
MTYDDLKETTEGWTVRPCAATYTPCRPGVFNPTLLPMTNMDPGGNERIHGIDYIPDHVGAIDIVALQEAYKSAILNKTLDSMPEPFGFKIAMPSNAQMQINVLEVEPGQYHIVKHCIFKTKFRPSVFVKACFGQPMQLTAAHAKIGPRIWQYCFQNLAGHLLLCNCLSAEGTKQGTGENTSNLSEKTDTEIEDGFAYIQKNAAGLSGVRLLLWQTKALKNDTPIRGWPIQLAKEIVRLIVVEGALVKKEYQWPLTLTPEHFHVWFLEILEDVYEFDQVALGLLGESGAGKSPAGRTVLLSQGRYNHATYQTQHIPCLRVTTEFDFLRGELGNISMCDFLDDGGVFMIVLKSLLAFTDVGLWEAVAWARWGLTKWIQKQPRGFSDNAYYNIDTKNEWPELEHSQFLEVIQPSIHEKATQPHIEALLKRVAYIVVAKEWVAWRPAGKEAVGVKRKFLKDADFLTDLGKEWYGKYRNGCREMPENHQQLVEQEQAWVTRVLKKNHDRRLAHHIQPGNEIGGDRLFPAKKRPRETALMQVKKEVVENIFHGLKFKPMHTAIDLSSPSPVKRTCTGSNTTLHEAIHQSRVEAGMSVGSVARPEPEESLNPFDDAEADVFFEEDTDLHEAIHQSMESLNPFDDAEADVFFEEP